MRDDAIKRLVLIAIVAWVVFCLASTTWLFLGALEALEQRPQWERIER